jgi:osmotically-inducible protein OsmY
MTLTAFKTDQEIQEDVYREFRWDSRVAPEEIGVQVDNGVVTLTGTVKSYGQRLAAREAAHRVAGVLDVADDVRVEFANALKRSDTQIAQAIRTALTWNVFVPDDKIQTTVVDGYVTLEGEVETLREKIDAELAVQSLAGVREVSNRIAVKPVPIDPKRVREAIESALERRAEREAHRIRVGVEDGRVILDGVVRSWAEKEAILGAVGHARGVHGVGDRLSIVPTA